jgi:hypothetical protein
MLYSIDNLISAIRFFVGFLLMVIALRAYLRTGIPAMLLLTIGFSLITLGDLFSSLYYIEDAHMDKLLSNVFDILGLFALIIAVRKS